MRKVWNHSELFRPFLLCLTLISSSSALHHHARPLPPPRPPKLTTDLHSAPSPPVARAPQPRCSPPTLRRRAPVPAPETGAFSAKEAAKRLSPMKRAECRRTWTSLSFTPCGEATTATGRVLRQVSDPSDEDQTRQLGAR